MGASRVTGAAIRAGFERLGIAGAVEVHSSLSAFGHVEGGAEAVVDAVIGVFDLVLVPTFTYGTYASPPEGADLEQNGIDDGTVWDAAPEVFHADMAVAREIGVIPETLRKRPGALRSMHPIESFAALGEGAAQLVASQTLDEPLQPIARLFERGGWVVMMGTDLTSCTAVHLGEARAGRRYFVRWCADGQGRRYPVRVSGCSRGFCGLEGVLAPIAREVTTGGARIRAYPGAQFVSLAAEAIKRDGTTTVCRERCRRCLDARAGGPIMRG